MRSGELQLLQSSPPESAARSQWPRAAHSGLMHCTVHPGKYCTLSPLSQIKNDARFFRSSPLDIPWARNPRKKLPGFCAAALVVSREKIQFLVVGLQNHAGAARRGARRTEKSRRNLHSSFTTLWGLHTICACSARMERDKNFRMRNGILRSIAAAFFLLATVSVVHAQQQPAEKTDPNAPDAPQPAGSADPTEQNKTGEPDKTAKPITPVVHKFWDRENDVLFAAVGAGRALDYASTLNLRHRGIDEAFLTNSIVDNHPLFATIEVGATAASLGVSYIFHRTGHHRLERWTSAIHAGIAVGGAIRNYGLKSPHP